MVLGNSRERVLDKNKIFNVCLPKKTNLAVIEEKRPGKL